MDTRQQLTCGTSFQIVGQPSSSQPFSHGPRRAQHTWPNLTNMHGRTQEPNTRDPPLARSSSSQRSRLPLVPLPVRTSQIEPGRDRQATTGGSRQWAAHPSRLSPWPSPTYPPRLLLQFSSCHPRQCRNSEGRDSATTAMGIDSDGCEEVASLR